MKYTLALILTCMLLGAMPLLGQSKNPPGQPQKPKVTFIELGSVKCVPCRAMQPVMRSIEEKYPSDVKVIFYDVWTQGQQRFAQEYKIRVIPTQVFLDQDGKELMRHEGFFPEKDIEAFLQSKGVKPKPAEKG